ncbi:Zinc finger protein [Plakobranchus ocellatus]|uniref:Zinc finger protein n=1 Tax=Plakobranchus ocellatus TaxID=259542 RepID=A0AAV3WUC2_9GAST|nr:Zinc finger protein [Plakobranchus ocellatus]
MITSNLVDAEVRVRTITQPGQFSAFFKLCFRLCNATHIVFATIAAVTVACVLGTSFLPHFVQNRTTTRLLNLTPKYTEKTVHPREEMSNVYIGAPLPHASQFKVVTE